MFSQHIPYKRKFQRIYLVYLIASKQSSKRVIVLCMYLDISMAEWLEEFIASAPQNRALCCLRSGWTTEKVVLNVFWFPP